MNPSARFPVSEVAYFRDPDGTWFAADVVRCLRWNEALAEPLDVEQADIRIALVGRPDAELSDAFDPVRAPAELPSWLRLLHPSAEREPRLIVDAALDAWGASEAFRRPGAAAEDYLVAGYQALCPPHPPCAPGPGMRESLMGFLIERPGPLGQLARGSDDAANRLFRLAWPTPEAFADDVLRERIRDDGARGALQLVAFVEGAGIDGEAEEYADLAAERTRLLARLRPRSYFTQASDFDRAAALALDWRARYQRAYQAHYRMVLRTARSIVAETAQAAALLAELEAMNERASPVGAGPAGRLRAALDELGRLPEGVDDRSAQTAGVVLGAMPHAIAEARISAAAVLAAVEVHRRRQARLAREHSGQHQPVR